MIVCIWYPSGGFGHFLNAVLTLHGKNFPGSSSDLTFSATGDSHAFPLALPKYLKNPKTYTLPDLDPSLDYPVLIDNGINDESIRYRHFFPGASIIKICYDDYTWPIVSRTMIEKAMAQDFSTQVSVDPANWPSSESWTIREKYFLFLRDHPLRHSWKPDKACYNLQIGCLVNYDLLLEFLSSFGTKDTFRPEWQQCMNANQIYIGPIQQAQWIMDNLSNSIDLLVEDVWTQAVVNYYIWLRYQFEVPANDYAAWFTNTKQIAKMLEDHGISI